MHSFKKITGLFASVTFLLFSLSSCHKKASASFAYYISENGMVTFTNTSSYSNNYVWEFGDSTTSEDLSPVHTYTKNGTYTVTLHASTGKSITQKSSSSDESQVITVKNVNFFKCDISGYGNFYLTGAAVHTKNSGSVEISAYSSNYSSGKKITITLPFVPAVNVPVLVNYGNLKFTYYYDSYNTYSGHIADQNTPNSSGTLTLQQNDSEYMKGTFEFKAFKGATDSVVVTNGTFSVTF